jgi:exonuclease III
MTNIKLISLNICNDDDLIYGTSHLKSDDILKFIDYHDIKDDKLILDLKTLYNTKMSLFDDDKFNIENTNIDYLDKSIISYHILENKLRYITVKVPILNDYKIRYINNLDPDIVDSFMTLKKKKLIESIESYDADFVALQELDLHNLPTENDSFRELLNSSYNMISPLDLNNNNNTVMLTGMTTNYILYKKEHYLIESYLKEYGIIGVFLINDKHFKFISGRWMPMKLNKDIRLIQYRHLDSDVKLDDHIVFMGDTNLRSYEITKINFLTDVTIKSNHRYTINKYINEYFINDYKYLARYDRIFTYGVKPLNTDLAFYKPYQELKNKYRKSGNISDHFGLFTEIIL